MKLTSKAALCFAAVTLPSVGVLAQSNVAENQTTNLYVDAVSGTDAVRGMGQSINQPLRTLQAAVNVALANSSRGIGTRVLINPGVYREALILTGSSTQTEAPITLQAAQAGTAAISGSDLLTNWYQGGGNRSIYSHPWNYNFGECPVPSGWPHVQPITRRREMIFVNDTALTQVLSMSAMKSGTFYVDEGSNVIHVWPAPGTNMGSAKVEAAVRSQTLNISGQHNVVLRGVVLQHAASCINEDGATISGSSNVLVDGVQVKWNNWGGLGIDGSTGITVRNSKATNNGGVGFASFHSVNSLYDSDESDYNNWRGAMGGLFDWGMGGAKMSGLHNATVTNFRALHNQAQGLWFDTDDKNITISNVHLVGNAVANLQLEANEGPISLTNSTLCSGDIGLSVIDTEGLTVSGNTFYDNSGGGSHHAQFFLAGNPGGRSVTDWETHRHYFLHTSNTTLRNNAFQDGGGGQSVFATYLAGNDWNQFASNLNASGNRWYDPGSTTTFVLPLGRHVNLSGWQSATRTDYGSSWSSDARAAGCNLP